MPAREALRATVGTAKIDVPTGTWVNGQYLRYNATGGPNSTPIIDTGLELPGTYTAGDSPQWNGSAFVPKRDMVQPLSADVGPITTTLTNIFIHSLPRVGTYWLHYSLVVACDTVTPNLVTLQLVTNANFTRYAFSARMQTVAGAAPGGGADVVASIQSATPGSGNLVAVSHSPAATGVRSMSVVGTVTVSTIGNFTLQLNRATSGNITCFAGSSLRITEQ